MSHSLPIVNVRERFVGAPMEHEFVGIFIFFFKGLQRINFFKELINVNFLKNIYSRN